MILPSNPMLCLLPGTDMWHTDARELASQQESQVLVPRATSLKCNASVTRFHPAKGRVSDCGATYRAGQMLAKPQMQ